MLIVAVRMYSNTPKRLKGKEMQISIMTDRFRTDRIFLDCVYFASRRSTVTASRYVQARG